MEIKTSLKRLMGLFGQSATNETLDPSVRRYAAQNMVLVAHVQRLEAGLDAEKTARKKLAEELKVVLAQLAEAMQPAAADSTQTAAPAGDEAETPIADADATIAQMQREEEAFKAAARARTAKPAEVTQLPVGNGKPSTPGAA